MEMFFSESRTMKSKFIHTSGDVTNRLPSNHSC